MLSLFAESKPTTWPDVAYAIVVATTICFVFWVMIKNLPKD